MANHPNRSKTCRPREYVRVISKQYPQAWKQSELFRADRGKDIPDWPQWCFMPLAAAYSIVSAEHGVSRITDLSTVGDVSRIGALAAWRITQGMYRFDPALFPHIWSTPVSGDIPVEVLYQMPEWCVYVETPDTMLKGFFAHLEWDINHRRPELRLLLDSNESLIPVPLHIGQYSLEEAIERALDQSRTYASVLGMEMPSGAKGDIAELVEPCVSLLLYLCSQNGEIAGDGVPGNPKPKKTKKGWRLFPAQKQKVWDVGVRMGAGLRRAYQHQQAQPEGESESVGGAKRPHIRRAHWHTYWKGSGDDKRSELKWLPPIAVKLEDEDLPAVVRVVK